jgi:hypothetical protein
MPVIIASKSRYVGNVTPPAKGVETTVIEINPQQDDYIVEGYLDLRNLAPADILQVTEYMAVDGANYGPFLIATFFGSQRQPIVRIHSKMLAYNMKYKLTVTQQEGSLKTIPYAIIVEVLGTA